MSNARVVNTGEFLGDGSRSRLRPWGGIRQALAGIDPTRDALARWIAVNAGAFQPGQDLAPVARYRDRPLTGERAAIRRVLRCGQTPIAVMCHHSWEVLRCDTDRWFL